MRWITAATMVIGSAIGLSKASATPVLNFETFDFALTGVTSTGTPVSAFLHYDTSSFGCCGGFRSFTPIVDFENIPGYFSVSVDDPSYSYLSGQRFFSPNSKAYVEQYDGTEFVDLEMTAGDASISFQDHAYDHKLIIPAIDLSDGMSYSFELQKPYNSLTITLPSEDGESSLGLDLDVTSATIYVAPVPLPTSLPLFAGALLICALFSRFAARLNPSSAVPAT